ncbi:hypothetical protein [Leptospira kmetyi]|uniref:Tetratricopeptide repeat protein n=1 Tax=Leptospira kmetyi TaxID=408139 RepID=A0ABX4N831_9LEPT|nr:hypothetical protein [Leptospira kmetyi]PJZ29478.1 hypothetical protein CH378_12355 [Leptospira kmetyi]
MKSIYQIFSYISLLFLLLSYGLFSQDSMIPGSHEDGEKLLEEKQYSQAEKLAVHLLTNNPSDPKAEFILTRAWIGIGREEAKKGSFDRAKLFLQKAYSKWPLNQELKSEIESISKKANQRSLTNTSFSKGHASNSNTIILLDSELYRSIENLKEELNSLYLQTQTNKNENSNVASREKFYQTSILVLILFSALNLMFTIVLWRRR